MSLAEIILLLDTIFQNYGVVLVFVGAFIETTPLGWKFPGGSFLIAGGYFAHQSDLSLLNLTFSGALGSWSVFLLSYYLGRRYRHKIIHALSQEKSENKAAKLIHKHGTSVIWLTLVTSLIRFWIAYHMGKHKHPFANFALHSAGSSLVWSGMWTGIGYIASAQLAAVERAIGLFGAISFTVLVILIYWFYKQTKQIL